MEWVLLVVGCWAVLAICWEQPERCEHEWTPVGWADWRCRVCGNYR